MVATADGSLGIGAAGVAGALDLAILSNTTAASIADAFAFMYVFEASCMIQVCAQSGGSELIPIPQPVRDGFLMAANSRRGAGPGALAWPALLRKLDRLDPSFRD